MTSPAIPGAIHGIVLCSDLDRTLIPNGPQPESPAARPLLRQLAARTELTLVYVSGRDQALIQQAIADYNLPQPQFAIGDVGTSILDLRANPAQPYPGWTANIARAWRGYRNPDLASWLNDMPALQLQEPEKQQAYKLSYYTPAAPRPEALLTTLRERLRERGVAANLIWSVDEQAGCGLLDILPASADKRQAIEFILAQENYARERTLFAGDSGNDLEVLVSDLRAVLVANADPEVKVSAREQAQASGFPERLFEAHGGLPNLNGNYAAGVIEGLIHYFPHTRAWFDFARYHSE